MIGPAYLQLAIQQLQPCQRFRSALPSLPKFHAGLWVMGLMQWLLGLCEASPRPVVARIDVASQPFQQ